MDQTELSAYSSIDFRGLRSRYLQRRADDVRSLREFLEARLYSEIRNIAHQIIGNAEMYQFDELAIIARNLREAAIAEDDLCLETVISQMAEVVEAAQP